MVNFGAEKIWHHFLNTTAQCRLWHKNKHTPRMLVVIANGSLVGCCEIFFVGFQTLAIISWRLLEACCYFVEAS